MIRSACGLALALTVPVLASGCLSDGRDWSVSRMLGWDDRPAAPKLPPGQLETAERVETLGRKIIAQNPFTGLDPLFHTIGLEESVLFHRCPSSGLDELFISEGLVRQCKTEQELAAVLASELGAMMAERKAVRRASAGRDSFPEIGVPTGAGLAGGNPIDPGREAEQAFLERQRKRDAGRDASDPDKLARELLRGAGFDPAELDRAAPILKQSERGAAIKKQMSGSAPAPRWEK